jgi:CBS domain-containing protein
MTAEPVTVAADATAAAAARLMLARGVRALPVVDDSKVVGVISASDVVEDYALAARG